MPVISYKPCPGTVNLLTAHYTNPLQGQLVNCPFMSALSSITWVNKTFIAKYNSGPDAKNYYTFTFWDYPGRQISLIPGSSINPVNADGTRIDPVAVPVSVKANTRLLDQYNNPQDANGYYGAGCNVPDQLWPVLYEKAYAKFCLYKMGSLSVAGLNDGNIDPTEISSLTKEQWGGNSAVTMMYMTGLSAYYYPTNLNAYNAIGGATSPAGDLFSYLRYGFCSEVMQTFGVNKTKFPMAAWTYPEDNPATHTLFGQKDISPDHCYSILGIYACQNGKNYVILRDTNGLHDPAINVNICTVPDAYKFWRYSDVLFKVGPLTAFTLNPAHILKQFDLSVNSDAVFGLEIGDFKKYFSHFGWVKGY